jgi:hypothetical protein
MEVFEDKFNKHVQKFAWFPTLVFVKNKNIWKRVWLRNYIQLFKLIRVRNYRMSEFGEVISTEEVINLHTMDYIDERESTQEQKTGVWG